MTESAPAGGFSKARMTVINRSSTPAVRQAAYAVRSSMGSVGFAPGVYSSISHDGVQGIKENRQKEKKTMQKLNCQLADYIERIRYIEAKNKELTEIIAVLESRKTQDFKPIKEMYETELAQSRKVIDQTCKEKAEVEAKNAGLQDELEFLKNLVDTLQKQARDYISKIDTLTAQNGEYEGDRIQLQNRIGNQEDEILKLREMLAKYQEEIRKLRSDVDAETAAHIEADNRAQSFEEECEFLRALLDKMPQESQQIIKIKGLDPQEYWKGEMAKAIRDLSAEYDNQLDNIRIDSENKQMSLMRQLQSGAVKDNLELNNLKEEVKKIRSQNSQYSTRLADLEARLAASEAEKNELARQLRELEHELELERQKHSEDCARLQGEIEACLEELRQITDAKMNLEIEIATYRQLLEGEENRVGLKQIVEQAVGVQGRGGAALSDILQQSNLSESTGRLTIKRSSRGPISILEAAHDGSSITIENTAAKGKNQNLRGWSIVRKMSSGDPVTYKFPDYELRAGSSVKVVAKGAAAKAKPGVDLVADVFTFNTGSGTTQLLDDNGDEKANMKASFTGN